MFRTLHTTLLHLLVLCGIAAGSLVVFPAPLLHAQGVAPEDVPVPVVSDNVEEWTVGQGLVYWADNCFADEFNPFANLKRQPASGGTAKTLEAINDGNRCSTYQNLLSSGDGLYYFGTVFSPSQNLIQRMPLSAPFTAQVVKTLSNSQTPVGRFVEAAGYLYWVSPSNKVFRTLKDGTGPVETVADTASSPTDVVVAGTTVFWTDSSGVSTIGISCGTLPCNDSKGQFADFNANTLGYGLVYIPLGGVFGSYGVYWVERTTSGTNYTYQIRYRACNGISICTLVPPNTFYTATVNWQVGNLVYANGNLYWTERDISTVNNVTGDVKRKVRTNPAGGADTIASNQSGIDPRLFIANDTLFYARRSVGIYSLSLNASAILRDLSVDGMEVTQAIQNLANDAPLVAQKVTYVRAYGKQLSGPDTPNVEARLAGTKNGAPLPGSPLAPVNGVRSLKSGAGYDRARLNDGWYFQLPASWTNAGAVSLRVEVDPRLIHTDPDRSNNERTQSVNFQDQPPVCVWTVPVRTHTPKPSTTDPNFWSMVSHFDRRWPVPQTWIYRDTDPVEELQVCWEGPFPYPCYGPYELEDGWSITNGPPDRDKVIISLWTRAQLTFNPDQCDNIDAPVHFMGMVHPDANNGGASGYASLIANESWVQLPSHTPNPIPPGWNNVRPGRVMAQELAHNYGRKHVDCGNPEGVDGNYPYPPCQISNVGPDQYYGFDTTTLTPIRPDQASDFMSYGNSQWVSDYTWRALVSSFAAVKAASASPTAPDAGNGVFTSGWIDTANNRGKISTVLVLPNASVPPATRQSAQAAAAAQAATGAPQATFRLRFLDSTGAVLANRTLTPIEMDVHTQDGHSALFSDFFNQPGGQVATIQLLADDTVIDSLTPGIHPPTVAIQQPAGGAVIDNQLTITWTASDPDPGDHLLYTVQYSHNNGAAWHTIVTNDPGLPNGGGTITLDDLGSLPGGGANQSRIRVLASDGYNTGIATSQAFTVNNRKPDAFIVVPVSDQTFPAGQAVTLQGGATDAEDGGLSGAALAWTVDGLSSGTGTDVAAAGLAPGAHTAVLTASDSDTNQGMADVAFDVAPLSVPITSTLVLDGKCDDNPYTGAASVQLRPYGDNSQATMRLMRTDPYLWACFSGLTKGALAPGAFAGLRIDVNRSRNPLAQATDYGFFAGEDGSVFTYAGDGGGGFTDAGPGGLQAQVSIGATTWSAELRIDKAIIDGWDHLVGLNAGHFSVGSQGDDYMWPYKSVWNKPNTWATTALGDQPEIDSLDPYTATVNSAAFTLNVGGSGFVDGDTVLWDGSDLTTTFVDSTHLTAAVGADQLNGAGTVAVSVRSPAPGNFKSNEAAFDVEALPPAITNLSPASLPAGSPTTTITVDGSHFAADAQVLWNGTPVPTQFISAAQLKAQLGSALLAFGQTAGVAVRNQTPVERISEAKSFEVTAQAPERVFLPWLHR